MKKLLFIFSGLLVAGSALAQFAPCDPNDHFDIVPDTTKAKDFWLYPDEAACVPVGANYQEILYFKIPTEAEVGGGSVTIESVVLNNVSNLPAGLSYETNKSDDTWDGGEVGCVSVQGQTFVSPQTIVPGIEFTLNISLGTTTFPQDTTFTNLTLTVQDPADCNTAPASVLEINNDDLMVNNYPQPADQMVTFGITSNITGAAQLSLFNIIGAEVMTERFSVNRTESNINFDLSDLPEGIYVYKMKINNNVKTGNIIINR